jgi:cell division protein FtsX
VPEWRGRGYLFHASIWSSVGAVMANILFLVSFESSLDHIFHILNNDSPLHFLGVVVFGMTTIFGPFVATAIGWLVGLLAGLAFARGRIKNPKA